MNLSRQLLIDHIRDLASQGATLAQTAEKTGLSYNYLSRLSGEHQITFARQMMKERPAARARALDMRQRFENGETLEQIGQRYGITRERVRQILGKKFGMTARDGGKAEIGRRKRRELHKVRDAKSQKVWGCSYCEYQRILKHEGKPTYAYWAQRKNANTRGISWEMSLWQWWKLWEQSGHWAERGRGRGYHMCRLNDVGPYSVDNVYIARGDDNMRDYWANKRRAESQEIAA